MKIEVAVFLATWKVQHSRPLTHVFHERVYIILEQSYTFIVAILSLVFLLINLACLVSLSMESATTIFSEDAYFINIVQRYPNHWDFYRTMAFDKGSYDVNYLWNFVLARI